MHANPYVGIVPASTTTSMRMEVKALGSGRVSGMPWLMLYHEGGVCLYAAPSLSCCTPLPSIWCEGIDGQLTAGCPCGVWLGRELIHFLTGTYMVFMIHRHPLSWATMDQQHVVCDTAVLAAVGSIKNGHGVAIREANIKPPVRLFGGVVSSAGR